MYNTSELFAEEIVGENRKFRSRIKYGDITSEDSIKSIKIYSQNTSTAAFTVGGAFSSYVALELWKPEFSIENKEFQIEIGLETEEGIEWCSLGHYRAETVKKSIDGMMNVTAYDRLYSAFSSAYFSDLTYPTDAKNILNEIASKVGVGIEVSGLPSGVIVNKRKVSSESTVDDDGNKKTEISYENPFNGYTYREALGYVAMLYCKYAIMARDGSVKLVWYKTVDRKITDNEYYDDFESAELAFSVGKVTCANADGELSVGSGTNNVQLENPVMTQDRLNYIYEQLSKLQFVPIQFSFYGDLRLDICDVVTVQATDGNVYNVPIMNISQDFDGGLKTSIQSYGGTEQENAAKGSVVNRLERLYTETLLLKEIVANKATFDYVYALTGEFKTLKAEQAEFENVVTNHFNATDAEIKNLKSTTITAETADLKYATIESLKATNANIEKLNSKAITTDNLSAKVAELGYLSAETADLKFATIESLKVTNAELDKLSSKSITTDNLEASVAKLGYLSVDKAEIGYAKIDFSNVGTQVVSSSMIKDGAVTNEKVGNLSANKITSGTIDASKITVTNLNADNLTVGTINGKLIGNGSVDLDKLSEEVATKEYLDKVQNELQGQIDGAIETFTKTEIPTLNNEPASLWTDNDTKKKHIGDICYVVNPASSADGYCYRFADLGTASEPNYSWVLIKDSDVTKALQDIIDINGEITGIKKFDSEISSWKTDTDSELSSLKSKTSILETEMGTKVETSTFNTLKQSVDNNTSNITSLSNTVKNKADASTVTTLTNTVNEVKQTADTNSLSITSMKSEIENKADGETVTALSKRTSAIEQDLSGFKTTVSNTYTTKEELKLYSTTIQMNSAIEQKANEINLVVSEKVGSNEIISKINQSAETVTISASKLNLSGYLTISNADQKYDKIGAAKAITDVIYVTGTTTINGEKIATGSIKANSIDVENLFAQDITATGTISGLKLTGTNGQFNEIDIRNRINMTFKDKSDNDATIEIMSVYAYYDEDDPDTEEDESSTMVPNIWIGADEARIHINAVRVDMLEAALLASRVYSMNPIMEEGLFLSDKYVQPYRSGDSFYTVFAGGGFVANGKTEVWFTVPLSKPHKATSVTITPTTNGGLVIRQGGKYTHGSSASGFISPSSYTATLFENAVRIKATFEDTTNAVNNDACGVTASIRITFA